MAKNDLFKVICKSIIFHETLILLEIWVKNYFSEWSQNNVVLLEILIFLDILTIFSIDHYFKEIWRSFSLNFDIFWDMAKKWFFPSLLKKTSFYTRGWYLRRYGIFRIRGANKCGYYPRYRQKTIFKSDLKITLLFSKCWYFWKYGQKTNFPKWSKKQLPFPSNVDIYVDGDIQN